jgi:hypothetical protein
MPKVKCEFIFFILNGNKCYINSFNSLVFYCTFITSMAYSFKLSLRSSISWLLGSIRANSVKLGRRMKMPMARSRSNSPHMIGPMNGDRKWSNFWIILNAADCVLGEDAEIAGDSKTLN